MIRFAADEDLNNDIVRALRRRLPEVDVARVRDAGLSGASDEAVLAWAAETSRVILTHDVSTMTKHAIERTRLHQPMPGVIAVHQRLAIRDVVEDLVLVATCSVSEDWADRIHFLPLR
jgi:predicted nuclease of predicted toxin-antitoxin system